MQNSTETPSTSATQYTQNNGGRDPFSLDASFAAAARVGDEPFPRVKNIKKGRHAIIPRASRHPPKAWANHPTISGADVASSDATTLASETAMAFISPC